jgi:hypothetical protein
MDGSEAGTPAATSTFRAIVELAGKTATGVTVPEEAVAALNSGKRVPVVVSINGYSYRSTVSVYAGVYALPIAAEHREAAGIKAGEIIEVQLQLDRAPREVEVPEALAEALAATPAAKAAFEKLSFSNKRMHVLSVAGAKTEETRRRRIEKVIKALS